MKPNKLTPGHNLKWESSRMMLPEHVDALQRHYKEQKRKQRPEMDEQHIEELERSLRDFIRSAPVVYITVFGEFEDRELKGRITKLDPQLQRVKVELENDDYEWISFYDILDIFM